MVNSGFVPDAGDLVWLTFGPQVGREQTGRRPALILSPRFYNLKSGLALACPITSRAKGYPFEVKIDTEFGIAGVILADQVKSIDWRWRGAERIGECPPDTVRDVLARLGALVLF